MKRSAVNDAVVAARATCAANQFKLPGWADWTIADHHANPAQSRFLTDRQIGWACTDFGSGNFARRGLTLLCLRNGIQSDAKERPYCEKLLFVGEDQETPFHCHKVKLEDIIVRGGGNLMVEFSAVGSIPGWDDPRIDGAGVDPFLGPHRITPGASITIPRGLQHRFYGENGHGPVFVIEVSQCSDDLTDNYFHEPGGQFSAIAEDVPALWPMWNEVQSG